MDITCLKKEYDQNMPTYVAFCKTISEELDSLLRVLKQENKISYYELSYRIKEWDSISEKLERRQHNLAELGELNDLVGFRIIALFKRDIELICSSIEKQFERITKDIKLENFDDDEFGYLSIHYQLTLPETWTSSPSKKIFGGMEFELQIRTICQHVWASASHVLQYKKEEFIPSSIRRRINALAGNLEIIDDMFEKILLDTEVLYNEAKAITRESENINMERLNVVNIERFLDDRLPKENRKSAERYAELLSNLSNCGINTIGALDAFLLSKETYIKSFLDTEKSYQPKNYYSHVGLVRLALIQEYGKPQVYRK